MHKKTKGSIAEMAVAASLLSDGWHVLFPVGEYNRYDLAAEKEGRFVRIQVKYVTPKSGALEVNCKSSNNWSILKYTKDEIDAMAVYNSATKDIYFIPVNKINRSSFKLRFKKAKNNQRLYIHRAIDFTKLI